MILERYPDQWREGLWLGNTLNDYGFALLIFVSLTGFFYLTQWVILHSVDRLIKRTRTQIDDAVVEVIKTVRPPFYIFIAFYAALVSLDWQGQVAMMMRVIMISWVVYQIIRAVQVFIGVITEKRLERVGHGGYDIMAQLARNLAGIILWTLGILFVLQNVGVNVTSLITGLGIGGIAIALGAQKVLGDFFSALAIYFDRPFEVGDFIEVGGYEGRVRKIGVKTTRIRSISGEEIIIANTDLTGARVRNFGRIGERRVEVNLKIPADTANEKLEKLPGWLKEQIEGEEGVRFERAHLVEIDGSRLRFEVIFFVANKGFSRFRDTQHRVLLKIREKLSGEGIKLVDK